MLPLLKTTVLLLVFLMSLTSTAGIYLDGSYGYSGFQSSEMKKYDASLQGLGYRFAIGLNGNAFDMEFFYRKEELKGDISPSGKSDVLHLDGTTYGLLFAFNILRSLSLNLGYQFVNDNYYIDSTQDEKRVAGIIKTFGLTNDEEKDRGLILGLTHELISGKRIDIYTRFQRESYQRADATEYSLYLGLRLKFDFTLDSIMLKQNSKKI